MVRFEFSTKTSKEGFVKFTKVLGKTLIDVEHRTGEGSCVEDSDSLILHFNDGSEILVYGDGEATITVEED